MPGIPGSLFCLPLYTTDGMVPHHIMGVIGKQPLKKMPEPSANKTPSPSEIKRGVDNQTMVAIFGGGDIKNQFPASGEKFSGLIQ